MTLLLNRPKALLVLRGGTLLAIIFVPLSFGGAFGQAVAAARKTAATVQHPDTELFRVEKISVDAGADLITIFLRRPHHAELQGPEFGTPVISVLRDTLGDREPDNDRLRYVWLHSYAKPSLRQRAAAFVPFLYSGASKRKVGNDPAPVVLDLSGSDKVVWHKLFWYLFKRMVVNDLSAIPKASAMQYRYNSTDHYRSAVADSIAALALFQELEGEKVLSDSELIDLQARLSLTDKIFGWKMQSENLRRVFEEDRKLTRDFRGHNWELLRQYTEEQGLYFEPLVMPDGFARHAIVWTSQSDIKANRGRSFNKRFLNIKSPWNDKRLIDWEGYSQVRWFDADYRQVEPGTPGATAKTMIPLALYGLDHPKVPMILVDFRDARNPKYRELSRRVLLDVTDNILAMSQFHSIPYFMGRMIYDFVTGRRGMDLNQASRFRSYSQLRLLLSIDEPLHPKLRNQVSGYVDTVSTNPMSTETESLSGIAQKQYRNLLAYAKHPHGLSKAISDDRREEMVPLKHSRFGRAFFSAANVLTLGLYTHREKATPQLMAHLDETRQLAFHERFLREVAADSAGPEIDTDLTRLRESLRFIADRGDKAEVKTSRAIAKIYAVSTTDDLRMLCLTGLYKINNASAKRELLAIYKASKPAEKSHGVAEGYLKRALAEGKRISSQDALSISAIGGSNLN